MNELHDELGHWDNEATQRFVQERIWWPRMQADVSHYVKTCDTCQRMKNVQRYVTNRFTPHSELFDVFSIDFAGPLPTTDSGNRFLLVCVKHLTGWPIVRATDNSTVSVVIRFMEEEIIPPFGALGFFISDNSSCFTALELTT